MKQNQQNSASHRKENYDIDKFIDFTQSMNPLGCSPKIGSFFSRFKKEHQTFPDNNSHSFINVLSGYHGLPENSFLSGKGSTEFLYLLPKVFRPKTVLVTEPVFRNYAVGYSKPKAVVFYKNLLSDSALVLNTQKLFKELKRGYRALYLSNPISPAGRLIPRQDLEKIVHFSKNRGIRIILDESGIDYHEDYSMKNEVLNNAHLIILRSMSDFFSLPGLRVGYIISHPDTIDEIRPCQRPQAENLLPEHLAGEALKDKSHIRNSIQYFQDARQAFIQKLRTLPFLDIYRGDANFILVRLKPSVRITPAEICRQLLTKNIRIKSCEDVRELGDRFFRIPVKKKGVNNRLISELRKLNIGR